LFTFQASFLSDFGEGECFASGDRGFDTEERTTSVNFPFLEGGVTERASSTCILSSRGDPMVEGDDSVVIGGRGIIGFEIDPTPTGCGWGGRTEGRGGLGG